MFQTNMGIALRKNGAIKKARLDMRLTNKTLKYRWAALGEGYEYVDMDEMTKDWSGELSRREYRIKLGRPRHRITFRKIPKGRKRYIIVALIFDDNSKYQGIKVDNKYVTKKQMKEWETEALTWLIENGFVEESEDEE